MDPHKQYEIRCPVHGFVTLNDWEWQIINQPAFQRLRRVRQLAWTDQVYPGAMHTRFEHSLGVMHVASMLFDAVVRNSAGILKTELGYDTTGLDRHRHLVRLAALLHDIGHSPFSHASEELFPDQEDGSRKYQHEHYSAAIVLGPLRNTIENHKLNTNCGFKADHVASLIEGGASSKDGVFWRDLIGSQMDADRMDYLLRDSYHTGVQYGRFDLHRLVSSMTALVTGKDRVRLGIKEGGWHAAEALVLARYFMFTQVYFHKTRSAYDVHVRHAMQELLPGGQFPKPSELDAYLAWEDWRVLGLLSDGQGGEHGRRLSERNHYRLVYQTPEVPSATDKEKLRTARQALGPLLAADVPAAKNWYKTGDTDISVLEKASGRAKPLSEFSKVVNNLGQNDQVLLYTSPEDRTEAQAKLKEAFHGLE